MSSDAPTVLVIDDDVILAELLAAIVEGAGFQAVLAADGAEGLRLARSAGPALVLCDMSMPGVSGAEVIRSLRNDPSTSHLRLVLMSGHAAPDLRAIGADKFLAKPFFPEEVVSLLRTLNIPQTSQLAA